jgi:hypothetical protein
MTHRSPFIALAAGPVNLHLPVGVRTSADSRSR